MSMAPPPGANLAGTLQGQDLVGLIERLRQEQQVAAAEKAKTASAQAEQTQGQLQQAVMQPPAPQGTTLGEQVIGAAGNLASVVGQDQGFRKQAQQTITQQRVEMFKAREDNITRLRDVWKEKAKQAQDAQDYDEELKARTKMDQLTKLEGELRGKRAALTRDEALLNMTDEDFGTLLKRKGQIRDATTSRSTKTTPDKPAVYPPKTPEQAAALIQSAKDDTQFRRLAALIMSKKGWQNHPDILQAIADAKKRMGR